MALADPTTDPRDLRQKGRPGQDATALAFAAKADVNALRPLVFALRSELAALRDALETLTSAVAQATVDEGGVVRFGPHSREHLLTLAYTLAAERQEPLRFEDYATTVATTGQAGTEAGQPA